MDYLAEKAIGPLSFGNTETSRDSNINHKKETKVYHKYSLENSYTVENCSAMSLLSKIEDESIALTLTSPPYCIGKEYETSTSIDDFVRTHEEILPEILRVTKPGGSICWQIGYHVKNRTVQPLDYFIYDIMRNIPDIKLRNRIIWNFGHGLHDTARFSGRHEVLLWFTKGDNYFFELDAVRVPQRYPGKRHYKGPKKGEFSGNPMGKNPEDVWEIPNINANHCEKTVHPCQFPIGLAERVIQALCPKDGIVLDPFSGVCTTGAAAALHGRRFVGTEIVSRYRDIGIKRMEEALAGTLKYRSADIPVMDPSASGAVSRKPDHFN